MCRSLRYAGLLVPALFVIGCSEKSDGPPTGPEFHTILNTSSGCDVQHTSQLANSFFQPPRQQTVKNLVDLLANETRYSTAAKNTGFDIMAQIEGAVNGGTSGDPAVGSDLINHLLLCMYNPSTEATSYPETFPESFNVSLTPAAHGAFAERSGSSTSPVLSRPLTAPYTGIAPPELSSWQSIIPASVAPKNDPQRVVFYGSPATPADGQTYDWRSIPHNRNFNPNIIIGFCVDQSADPTAMVFEKDVAVLAFASAYFLTPGTCSSNLSALDVRNPFQLAHRLLRFGTELLAPRPLMATVLTSGSGGTKSKCCSIVGPQDVPSVNLTVTPNSNGTPSIPTTIKVNTQKFRLTATTKSGTTPVNGVKITLSTGTNNGTPTTIRKAASATADCKTAPAAIGITGEDGNAAGTYDFPFLCITSTGGVFVTITADVVDRNDQPVSLISNKAKVTP